MPRFNTVTQGSSKTSKQAVYDVVEMHPKSSKTKTGYPFDCVLPHPASLSIEAKHYISVKPL